MCEVNFFGLCKSESKKSIKTRGYLKIYKLIGDSQKKKNIDESMKNLPDNKDSTFQTKLHSIIQGFSSN